MNLFQKGLSQQLEGYVNATTDDLFAEAEAAEARPPQKFRVVRFLLRRWLRRQPAPPQVTTDDRRLNPEKRAWER